MPGEAAEYNQGCSQHVLKMSIITALTNEKGEAERSFTQGHDGS